MSDQTKCRVCNEPLEGHDYIACHALAEAIVAEQADRIEELEAENKQLKEAFETLTERSVITSNAHIEAHWLGLRRPKEEPTKEQAL